MIKIGQVIREIRVKVNEDTYLHAINK